MDSAEEAFASSAEEELCRIIRQGQETRLLDYKRAHEWNDKDASSAEIVKDILALANSGGGHLVIGVDQASDGRFDFVGMSDEQAKTWETTRIGNKVSAYAEPTVDARATTVPCGGKKFVVVAVRGFTLTPHICTRRYQVSGEKPVLVENTFYIRSETAQSRPIQSAAELRDLIERATLLRQDELLTGIRAILTGASVTTTAAAADRFKELIEASLNETMDTSEDLPFDGMYVDEMYPASFNEQRFTIEQLRDAVMKASVNYGSDWPFLQHPGWQNDIDRLADGFRLNYGQLVGASKDGSKNRYFYWLLRQSGLLVVKSMPWEVDYFPRKNERVLFKRSLVVHIAQSLDALVRLYQALGVTDEDITWRFEFHGAKDREFRNDPNLIPFQDDKPCKENVVSFQRTRSLEDWSAGLVDHAVEAIVDILEQVGSRTHNKERIRNDVREHLGIST
jgi:hypothetical protein